MIADIIRNTTREVMTSHYKQLFKFFLLAFDIRRQNHFDDSVTDELEDATISVFLDLVMKLNETLFKPLFLKVVDWALMELAEAKAEEGYEKRVIFFYKLVDSLLGRLKSIFTPYYNYVIDDVITRLQATEEPSVLWNHIMSSLSKSFLYDNDNLWNASKFDKILDPVINQMSVMGSNETPDQYMTRMTTYLVPCLGQMAVTVSNDTLWKPMNHKVLMKTREDSPEIRLAALKCLEEFYVRLGEEWLLFLAESISFLAELMEGMAKRKNTVLYKWNIDVLMQFYSRRRSSCGETGTASQCSNRGPSWRILGQVLYLSSRFILFFTSKAEILYSCILDSYSHHKTKAFSFLFTFSRKR